LVAVFARLSPDQIDNDCLLMAVEQCLGQIENWEMP
jgi:hypothetical protein